jgi:hypothetical protein
MHPTHPPATATRASQPRSQPPPSSCTPSLELIESDDRGTELHADVADSLTA